MSHKLRFVTAASLFDGHDVSINIIRRILQSKGVEVIHLGHNRSAKEVVDAAIQEDVHGIALSSYQGGHVEYFSYIRELLDKRGGSNIRIFGGGGGVITPKEQTYLESKGVTKIYSPKDGMTLGLDGIVDDMISKAHHDTTKDFEVDLKKTDLGHFEIGKWISKVENKNSSIKQVTPHAKVIGFTGTGGAGKSSLIDELLLRVGAFFPELKVALISIDPTKSKTSGALLGDRIRLGSVANPNLYVRSMATRSSGNELSAHTEDVIKIFHQQKYDLIILETSGIGQSSSEVVKISDKTVYVMTPEFGAATQLEKIDMLDHADYIVINKFEKPRSEDAFRDVRKQYCRNKKIFTNDDATLEKLPIYGTRASKFNDEGVNALFSDLISSLNLVSSSVSILQCNKHPAKKDSLISIDRSLYLREIASSVRNYNKETRERVNLLQDLESIERLKERGLTSSKDFEKIEKDLKQKIDSSVFDEIERFEKVSSMYKDGDYKYVVRNKEFHTKTTYKSLSGLSLPKVAQPAVFNLSQKYLFLRNQNLPGFFPYTAGVFPFKRNDEDPKRMFAGEGGPKRTNSRFHFLCKEDPAKRLSTAFDSVTLYGQDPDERPDIFGKVGESGVSIATLDDMMDLYSGFDLTDPKTSVSMTINGPAPIILAMFANTAARQKLDKSKWQNLDSIVEVMREVRGTVQADILKEDQAQNTCIFSLEFALKMMGDVQEFFSKNKILNYYTVSISGYHIAEAGANPITQLAFTLANGFTYVEYYLSRGLHIDEICPNLSFFFSNGLDPEYAVIGQVARKLWAVAMRDKYGANEKSQKFKYHIQTSGRSLHAEEIDFNDIRTTLQALLALSDNCNSLHTNAYDEAITTPTQESVRRAMAIQMIINREFGLTQTDNPMQGSYLYDELFKLVEEAVLQEFERLSDKGGVLGAMESQYQRSKIQDESMHYEMLKDSGELQIIGVNTYLAEGGSTTMVGDSAITRASYDEKNEQITRLRSFQAKRKDDSERYLKRLKEVVLKNQNIFEELLTTVQYCSLGQISKLLFEVGGQYRRNV